MKSKLNNKGFTLVELIIAITILTVVLGLGYNIIIGTNKATKEQSQIFSEQQNATLINKYLTKDLEQVKKFTLAETNINPYKYIINEDTDPIEYEVTKSNDGKHYSVTRNNNGSSIDIISNYDTNSETPFSITKVKNADNVFKVTLNGKGKDGDIAKYEFEVTSRVENVVSSGGIPVPPGGNEGEDNQGPDDTNKEILNGEIRVNFEQQNKHSDNITVIAKAFIKESGVEEERQDEVYNINKPSEYTIDTKIPVKNNNHLGISITNCKWNKNTSFKGPWDIFKEKLINKGIEIYSGKGISINSVKIDNKEVEKNSNGQYYFDLSSINKETIDVTVKVNVVNYYEEPFLSIGFGQYNSETKMN